jgi:maltose alpha-D-glucosyltransferase/alpha-amylase
MTWRNRALHDFRNAYLAVATESPSHPSDAETVNGLLQLFTIQKAIYEIRYEAANRPGWLSIPVRGILDLLK